MTAPLVSTLGPQISATPLLSKWPRTGPTYGGPRSRSGSVTTTTTTTAAAAPAVPLLSPPWSPLTIAGATPGGWSRRLSPRHLARPLLLASCPSSPAGRSAKLEDPCPFCRVGFHSHLLSVPCVFSPADPCAKPQDAARRPASGGTGTEPRAPAPLLRRRGGSLYSDAPDPAPAHEPDGGCEHLLLTRDGFGWGRS